MYDVIGVGIGPFNLSLAALLDDIPEVEALFFDKISEFVWHPGMLIGGTDLQVPFIADLVTFANPQSKYTFLNYLHHHNRLYQFFFFNRFDIPRREYNDYAAWVASMLESCHFGHEVIDVKEAENSHYVVTVSDHEGNQKEYKAKHVVIGTGNVPLLPIELVKTNREDVFHSSEYLYKKEGVKEAKSITVIGSGQSAAEIFLDLLQGQKDHNYEITWFTRSAEFLQLESAKLGQEVFSPDYVEYFHKLPFKERMDALPQLGQLRKGIDPNTLKSIYDQLYHRSVSVEEQHVYIQPLTEVSRIEKAKDEYKLSCEQWQAKKDFDHYSEKVILATGYKPNIPSWLTQYKDKIVWEDEKRFKVDKDYKLVFKDDQVHNLYTLTNIEHSHGAGATNLGLSVYRNTKIINSILGEQHFKEMKNTVFQQFSP